MSFGKEALSNPVGVSVDETGDIYVGNLLFVGNDKFDISHELVTPPSPFPEAGGVYSGAAVDPVNHSVYIVNAEGQAIDTFDPSTGKLESSFAVPGSGNLFGAFTAVQIASDAEGNVYVPNAPNNEVQIFNPQGEAPSGGGATTIGGSGANSLKAPEGVAIDSAGHVWVADTGDSRIEEFERNGAFMKEIASPDVQAVTVDMAGDVFASVHDEAGAHVIEFNPSGKQIDDFGLGVLHESEFRTPNSIAIDGARGLIYVADGGDSVVQRFASWGVVTHLASNVAETSATLNGTVEIEPGSEPVTSCEFEYGTTTSYGSTAACSPTGPYSTTTPVSADVKGLTAGAAYHFRVIATNAVGVTQVGEDEIFGPPTIDSQSAGAGVDSAVLRAKINPMNAETACRVQYVDEANFKSTGYANATTLPCSPSKLPGERGDQEVTTSISGLALDTVYHFHFIATSGAGTTIAPDEMFATFGVKSFTFGPLNQAGGTFAQAGGHPYELSDTFTLNTSTNEFGNILATDANPKDVVTELPPGLIGNPNATPKCSAYDVAHADCSGATQVGVLRVYTANPGRVESSGSPAEGVSPIYNLVPPKGLAAQFGARFNGFVSVHIDAKVRTGGDYGVTAEVINSSAGEGIVGAEVMLWGAPAEESHDTAECTNALDESNKDRCGRYCPKPGSVNEEPFCSERGPLKPFLTNPTSCSGSLATTMRVNSWQEPSAFARASASMSAMTGCGRLDFKPTLTLRTDSTVAESPSGLRVDLHVPQIENPIGLAEADLKDAAVTLPQGMTVNPASANGLVGCSPTEIELHGPEPAQCPDASKVGEVTIETPLLAHPLTGGVYVAQQGNGGPAQGANPFGSLLALYIAVHDPQSGVVVKLAGQVTASPVTGQLTTTFDENPQLPFEVLKLEFFDGERAPLITPAACGSYQTTSLLEPWSHHPAAGEAEGTPDAQPSSDFQVSSRCSHGFSPVFTAGTINNQAAGFSPFTLTLSRNDGEQRLSTVATRMPPGLAGLLAKVPLCHEAQANAGDCPAASKVGHVTVTAGAGTEPITLPQAGKPQDPVYLTGPYKGAPFGLSVVVPAEAGPFNLDEGGRPVVVRAKIEVDPHTAQVSVASDPMPIILQGIPVDVRTVNVTIDRPEFIFNPTDCNTLKVTGTIASTQGTSAAASSRFQAANCAALRFNPGFKVTTHAKHSRRGGAYLRVNVTSSKGQANVKSVRVKLPKLLASRDETLNQACSEKQFAANPAGCPKGSFVGTAIARTPVLPVPLTGPAIFVSHGGAAFPDLDVVLQGDGVTVDLTGNTNIVKNVTISTFKSVPDVPVSSFQLTLPTGSHSALAANGNLCTRQAKTKAHGHVVFHKRKLTLAMPTIITGQNGAVIEKKTIIKVEGCGRSVRGGARKGAKHKR